ncbi:DUF4232 domain-containing protein [Streptomyces phytohabitans]|uniref:DUF4232 domain-containing protein n=1 Tax=Streptomyces phytohabitans TaxID=1150371 RepID=UPI00345C24A7
MRARKLTIAAVAVAAGLSLTACQGDDDGNAKDDSSSESTTQAAEGGADSDGADGSDDAEGSGGADEDGGKDTAQDDGSGSSSTKGFAKCVTDDLTIKASDSTIGGDTTGSVAVDLTNKTDTGCRLSGFAGVDLKTAEGTLSATRKGEPADPTILKPGKTISFTVGYPMNDSGGSGIRVTGLVVTPPGDSKSVTLEWPGGSSLPVTDGSEPGPGVFVGPIGSAGQGGPGN